MSRYALNKAMYQGTRPESRDLVLDDKSCFVSGFDLDEAERAALSGPDFGARDGIVSLSHREIEAAGSSTAEIRSWIMLAGMFAGQPFERVAYEPIADWVTGCAQAIVRP